MAYNTLQGSSGTGGGVSAAGSIMQDNIIIKNASATWEGISNPYAIRSLKTAIFVTILVFALFLLLIFCVISEPQDITTQKHSAVNVTQLYNTNQLYSS